MYVIISWRTSSDSIVKFLRPVSLLKSRFQKVFVESGMCMGTWCREYTGWSYFLRYPVVSGHSKTASLSPNIS